MKGITTTSFRLLREGKEIPVQVDERDNTGLFLKEPNYTLDKDDEIVFQVDIPPGKEVTYFLYFSLKPKPRATYEIDIKVKSLVNNDLGQIRVTNSKLNFIVKGPRTNPDMDPKKIHFANFGCGAITSLRIKGIEMLHFTHRYAQVIPSSAVNIPYSVPEVVIDGAVRKIIKLIRDNHQIKDEEGNVAYEGKVIRYFAVYARSGRIDFEDNFLYSKWDFSLWKKITQDRRAMVRYNPSYAAGIFDLNDSLFIPVGGEIAEIDIGAIELKESGNQVFYSTPEPEEGWFAWIDKEEKVGLATFLTLLPLQ